MSAVRHAAGHASTSPITAEVEREGVRSFCSSYRELLDCIETKLQHAAAPGSPRS